MMRGHELRVALAEGAPWAAALAALHRFEHHRGQVGVPPLVERRVVPQLVNVLVGSDVEDLLLRTERGEPRGEPRERRSTALSTTEVRSVCLHWLSVASYHSW